MNLLIHEGLPTSPNKAIFEIYCSIKIHLPAWCELALPSLWIKGNFDVTVKGSFVVAATVLSDERVAIVGAAMMKLHCPDAL